MRSPPPPPCTIIIITATFCLFVNTISSNSLTAVNRCVESRRASSTHGFFESTIRHQSHSGSLNGDKITVCTDEYGANSGDLSRPPSELITDVCQVSMCSAIPCCITDMQRLRLQRPLNDYDKIVWGLFRQEGEKRKTRNGAQLHCRSIRLTPSTVVVDLLPWLQSARRHIDSEAGSPANLSVVARLRCLLSR